MKSIAALSALIFGLAVTGIKATSVPLPSACPTEDVIIYKQPDKNYADAYDILHGIERDLKADLRFLLGLEDGKIKVKQVRIYDNKVVFIFKLKSESADYSEKCEVTIRVRDAMVCTEEVRMCDDGSTVSQEPPLCEFALCPSERPTCNVGRIPEVAERDLYIMATYSDDGSDRQFIGDRTEFYVGESIVIVCNIERGLIPIDVTGEVEDDRIFAMYTCDTEGMWRRSGNEFTCAMPVI